MPSVVAGVASVTREARVVIYANGQFTHAPAGSIADQAPAVDGERTLATGLALPPVAEPAALAASALIYLDAADGDLKVKFANGIVRTIASN